MSHHSKEVKLHGDPLIFNFLLQVMSLRLCIRENKHGENNINKTFKIHHVGPALRISGNETTHMRSRRPQPRRPFRLQSAPTTLGASKTKQREMILRRRKIRSLGNTNHTSVAIQSRPSTSTAEYRYIASSTRHRRQWAVWEKTLRRCGLRISHDIQKNLLGLRAGTFKQTKHPQKI